MGLVSREAHHVHGRVLAIYFMHPSDSSVRYRLEESQRKSLLSTIWRSRLGDLREQSLIRQGQGWFHIAGMGHEAMAAIAVQLEADDYAFPYYRDRAFCLARGLSDDDLAMAFYAKRESSSGGRQLTGHFSSREHNIWSHPSPVGAHLLPACGAAWGMQLDGKSNVVYVSTGEASTRQGEFFEAVCFAKERALPMLFVVQDNRIAISTSTERTNPLAMGVLNADDWTVVDGCDVDAVAEASSVALERIRAGEGPQFLWCQVERLSNHSSADDQRMYRAEEDLNAMDTRDVVQLYEQQLIADGLFTAEEAAELQQQLTNDLRQTYRFASGQVDPEADELSLHLYGPEVKAPQPLSLDLGKECRMLDAVNQTFHQAMDTMPDVVFFGEDIADPKGGVFNLTKGLSSKDSMRAVNSPLAEATIMGVAVGLASYGKRPCFEIQFVDFIHPGWNQLVSNMATLRWRSFGEWGCPLVIYAPCGAYLPGGALWHSQSGEGLFAHVPGIRVVVPSTPEDTAGLFWSALQGSDPTLILLPKHLMWAEQSLAGPVAATPLDQARMVREGSVLTLVAWGNCIEMVEEVLDELEAPLEVELIDLRSIQPWDRETVRASVLKTGRLLVVQEDNETASLGQAILAEMCRSAELLSALKSPPALVSKADVHIGFNPIYEYGALPDKARIRAAIDGVLGSSLSVALETAGASPVGATTPDVGEEHSTTEDNVMESSKEITVPILGEGIRTARVVSLLKAAGDSVAADDALCEVETDKAVFPIECDEDGVLESWSIEEGDEVAVGQSIAVLKFEREAVRAVTSAPAKAGGETYESLKRGAGLSLEAIRQLEGIVPATIEMVCRWETVRDARLASKQAGGPTLSTAAMCAWAVAQAMAKHPNFSSYIRGGELVRDAERFDLGVAVALPGDVLDTAVISGVNDLSWKAFPEVFNAALRDVRHGKGASKNRVALSISSMGSYDVRAAIPVVVPPSVATLFIGAPALQPDPKRSGELMEVVSLVLTFDHRWVNGVGAASFLSDVRKGIERFAESVV